MTEERACGGCDQPIPAKRLAAMPNATMCVPCLQEAGDVPMFKGITGINVGCCGLEAQILTPKQFERRQKRSGVRNH
ncbi:MAG: TraR/DksA C4-type zinc finger protein [Terriglobales bacterium]|jgi:hypothetical protein